MEMLDLEIPGCGMWLYYQRPIAEGPALSAEAMLLVLPQRSKKADTFRRRKHSSMYGVLVRDGLEPHHCTKVGWDSGPAALLC